MAKLKTIGTYPYSGWHESPWTSGRNSASSEQEVAVDAAARTARRVIEPISWLVRNAEIVARRSGYRIMILEADDENFGVNLSVRPADAFLGHFFVPLGFQHVQPSERAALIGEGTVILFTALSEVEGWDPEQALASIRELQQRNYEFEWRSEWKSTRDRRHRVQLVARLADDGYSRWKVRVADGKSNDALIETEEFLGWTWIENAEKAAKAMKFVAPNLLEVPSGSGFWPQVATINIDTGEVRRTVDEPTPLLYPGSGESWPTPKLVVTQH